MSENTSIVASGQKFDIGRRVVLWDEEFGLTFYSYLKKYTPRSVSLDELRKEVKTFVLHHSVTYTAKQTYGGLLSRGLSVNFIIDDDENATIYQCLDIKDAAWSHAPLNRRGPGVEISYQPLATPNPSLYSEAVQQKYGVQPREIEEDKIHGAKLRVFPPSKAQIESCTALLWGFSELFPDIPPVFPRDASGEVTKTNIVNPTTFEGFLAHFHVTRNKIDPVGFPFTDVEAEVKLRRKWGY